MHVMFYYFFSGKTISYLELQLESRSIRLKNVNHFQITIDSLLCQVEEITKSLEQIYIAKKELANRFL